MDYVKIVLENILPVVFLIATPILVLLVRRLVLYLEKKWNFQMSEEQKASMDRVLTGAIGYAEEKALTAVKTDPTKLPDGAKKLDAALEFAMSEIKRMGLDDLAAQKLKELLEAKLFEMRAAGVVPPTLKPGSLPAVPKEWVDETLKKLGLPPKG